MNILQKLKERFPGIREGEPLKNHCTLRVGGPADLFYELTNIEELPELITLIEENSISYRIIGRGANILFTDAGFRGLIIKNLSNEMETSGTRVSATSGVLLAQIIRFCLEHGLSGLEPLWGIPGTIGGAIWGNAGIPKLEISKFLRKITIFNAADGVRELSADEIEFGYRWSSLQNSHEIIMRAELELSQGNKEQSAETIKQINLIRREKQPAGYSAGSFFKNPSPEKTAGLLIDQAGLKGYRIGSAGISEKHGNFLMNLGGATASQILELAHFVQKKVMEKFGIKLEMEVKIIET